MLDRIALHQTRLRTPGLGLDSKGVALGAKGVVLLPSIDRLVALLGVYTREHSLEDLMPSLEIQLVRSKLGTREIVLSFAAESSDRMDRMAETARLVGGFTFTGTSRHFVQYRDAAAPFGYDAQQLLATEAALVLYHDNFTQAYDVERSIDLRALLLRLMPHVDPSTLGRSGAAVHRRGARARAGAHSLLRSLARRWRGRGRASGRRASAFDEGPVRRYVMRVPDLAGAHAPAHERDAGHHVFPAGFAGRGRRDRLSPSGELARVPRVRRAARSSSFAAAATIRSCSRRLPQMGDLRAFARVELRESDARTSEHRARHGPSRCAFRFA